MIRYYNNEVSPENEYFQYLTNHVTDTLPIWIPLWHGDKFVPAINEGQDLPGVMAKVFSLAETALKLNLSTEIRFIIEGNNQPFGENLKELLLTYFDLNISEYYQYEGLTWYICFNRQDGTTHVQPNFNLPEGVVLHDYSNEIPHLNNNFEKVNIERMTPPAVETVMPQIWELEKTQIVNDNDRWEASAKSQVIHIHTVITGGDEIESILPMFNSIVENMVPGMAVHWVVLLNQINFEYIPVFSNLPSEDLKITFLQGYPQNSMEFYQLWNDTLHLLHEHNNAWVYFLNSDTILYPGFMYRLAAMLKFPGSVHEPKMIVWGQAFKNNNVRLLPDPQNLRVGLIDIGMFITHSDVFKQIKFDNTNECDGHFIEDAIAAGYRNNIIVNDTMLNSYHAYLRE